MIKENFCKNAKNEAKNNPESNKELPQSSLNKSFCSMDNINQNNNKALNIINKKRLRPNSNSFNNFLLDKINKLQKSQNSTNLKLDILLNIIKAKFYGEYSYEISHNDFFIQNSTNNNIKNFKDEKEDSLEYNISEDANTLTSIKKEPHPANLIMNNNLSAKKDKNELNLVNENNENKMNNLCDYINDTIALIQKETNKLNVHKNLSDSNILRNPIINDNGLTITPEDNKIKSINSSLKKEINLNKYKIEPKTYSIKTIENKSLKENEKVKENQNENINEKQKEDINKNKKEQEKINYNKKESDKNAVQVSHEKQINIINLQENNEVEVNLEYERKSNLPAKTEDDEFSIININEEKKINIDKKEENNIKEEDEKNTSSSQCDTASVRSSISNASGTKSNQNTSRRIRGFNFRNNIKMKKYNENINDNTTKK